MDYDYFFLMKLLVKRTETLIYKEGKVDNLIVICLCCHVVIACQSIMLINNKCYLRCRQAENARMCLCHAGFGDCGG